MGTIKARNYGCKDEELPSVCKFAAFSLNRDLADFTVYSPKFSKEYLAAFETRIAAASEVIEPQSETQELKIITLRFYATIDGLIDPINRLTGYITLSQVECSISLADFGIKYLRKGITARDAEGVIQSLHSIIANIGKYKEALVAQGLTEELIARFADAATSVANDKQKQYEIISSRKHIVNSNLALFNGLFGQLNEILTVGKILYKATDTAKLQEYTFTELKKRVRRTAKPVAEEQKA
jgi:hypothetical protein